MHISWATGSFAKEPLVLNYINSFLSQMYQMCHLDSMSFRSGFAFFQKHNVNQHSAGKTKLAWYKIRALLNNNKKVALNE